MRYMPVILILLILCVLPALSDDNISVYDYGTSYIIWDTGNNTDIIVDGANVTASGGIYGQYDLSSGTEHFACNTDLNCTGVTTKSSSLFVFAQWGVYIILMGMCIICYRYPITFVPSLVFGIYLIADYIPNTGGGFNESVLVVVLLIMSVISARAGMRI